MEEKLLNLTLDLNINQSLLIKWEPNKVKKSSYGGLLSGEVVGNTIHIYESNEEKALETLKHEVVDYYVKNKLVNRMEDIINGLIGIIDKEVYRNKEEVVETLCQILP